MEIQKECKWLIENSRKLEKFSGQWVVFNVNEGLVSKGKSLNAVLKMARKKKKAETPFIFHVPPKEEILDW